MLRGGANHTAIVRERVELLWGNLYRQQGGGGQEAEPTEQELNIVRL